MIHQIQDRLLSTLSSVDAIYTYITACYEFTNNYHQISSDIYHLFHLEGENLL